MHLNPFTDKTQYSGTVLYLGILFGVVVGIAIGVVVGG